MNIAKIFLIASICALTVMCTNDSTTADELSSAPAPVEDRVGFPKDYATRFKVISRFVYEREPRMITVYGNEHVTSIAEGTPVPYPNGAILVMEWANTVVDSENVPLLDANGNLQKGKVVRVDVMRREKGFGEAYGKNRSGEWEYGRYHPDGSHEIPPAQTASCAACHIKAGAEKDYVFPRPHAKRN